MSKMMLRSKCKPPLPRSPIRSQREPLKRMPSNNFQNTPGSLMKSKKSDPFWDMETSDLRPEYQTISYEIRALSKIVNQEYGPSDCTALEAVPFGAQRGPLFERGRFYDEYAARRNERLKRKKGEVEGLLYTKKTGYDLGVRVESAKKRDSNRRKSGTVAMVAAEATPMAVRRRASVAAATTTPMAERRPSVPTAATPRYSLRSSSRKDIQKPPLPPSMNVENSVGVGARRIRKA